MAAKNQQETNKSNKRKLNPGSKTEPNSSSTSKKPSFVGSKPSNNPRNKDSNKPFQKPKFEKSEANEENKMPQKKRERRLHTKDEGQNYEENSTAAWRKPPPIERKLACTLEELCHGGEKKIVIRKEVISEEGTIGEEEEILRINLKPGWRKGTKITFKGKGDQKPGYLPADIIFLIDEKRHPVFNREGDDLKIAVEIPLVQALTGCSLSIPLLGGEKMSLSIVEDIIFPGYEKVIRGQGMPNPKETPKRGDLIVKFLVNFPSDLSDEQRSEAVSVLQDCS